MERAVMRVKGQLVSITPLTGLKCLIVGEICRLAQTLEFMDEEPVTVALLERSQFTGEDRLCGTITGGKVVLVNAVLEPLLKEHELEVALQELEELDSRYPDLSDPITAMSGCGGEFVEAWEQKERPLLGRILRLAEPGSPEHEMACDRLEKYMP